ncbi:MAG: aminoacyl-histidine dipeptidase [Bacteroidales bacterium]|jgi:dipeptidase D|nr:aminoacyl-histidine dipeptidase [Bacteroidales bacterium]
MSKEIKNLEPRALWGHFYDMCQTPHPSKKEDRIRKFLVDYGKKLGLETIVDETGNVIIRKPATKGMENKMGVILQGHMDMVPQANSDIKHNFETDPIEPYIDGEWVRAKGTTLGADNGMGVAAGMAILEAKDLIHGPIEVLITTDEETGMTGANGLKSGILHGDILINLDSEDEGELYVGCAGGLDATITGKYSEEKVPAGFIAYKISGKGMKGGHSGMDIILGRANANKVLFRFFYEALKKIDMRIADVQGGSLRNAIPREAFATVTVPESQAKAFESLIKKMEKIFRNEYALVEPSLEFFCEKTKMPEKVMNIAEQAKYVRAIYACPNDVERMSNAMLGLVETSDNLAIVNIKKGKVDAKILIRSSVDTAKQDLANKIASVFQLVEGCNIKFSGSYPGWNPNMDSAILKIAQATYKKLYKKTPEIKAIHAGLECGILGSKYPKWDMISFGPTIRSPHSPDERVNIPSVEKFWKFLTEILKDIPEKK